MRKVNVSLNLQKINPKFSLGNIFATLRDEESSGAIILKLFKKLPNDKDREVAFKIFCEGKDLETVAKECKITWDRARDLKGQLVFWFRRELKDSLKALDNYINWE